MHKQILKIAFPGIVSNLTVPLLALTDTTIAGHISTLSLGAIAVAGTLFSILYNAFNFLRMGTGGFTSQAYGKQDHKESFRILVRSLATAILISGLLICIGGFGNHLLFHWMGASAAVTDIAKNYFGLLIWGAPAVLTTYVFTGWFLGMQDAQTPMWVAILQNIINIPVSLYCVYGLDMGTNGLAMGTLVAQYVGFFAFIFIWLKKYRALYQSHLIKAAFQQKHTSFFKVNRDIFFRTLCITLVQASFTSIGAHSGNLILAANALLMQFFIIQSYFMDGFAYAGEALGGRFYGADDRSSFFELLRKLSLYGLGVVSFFTLFFAFAGHALLDMLTNEAMVRATAMEYLPYAIAMPVCGGCAFLLDGIFIGCTATGKMLLAMLTAAAAFGICTAFTLPTYGNHGLWLSFLLFLLIRGIVEGFLIHKIAPKEKRL